MLQSGRIFLTGSKRIGTELIVREAINSKKNSTYNFLLNPKQNFYLSQTSTCIIILNQSSGAITKNTGYFQDLQKTVKNQEYYIDNQPLLEMISSFLISTTSIVLPIILIMPSFLNSERVLITFAVLIPI